MNFTDFPLPEGVLAGLAARGFTTPTPIQAETLPHTLEGRDVLGRARTGTGKTLAFALPIAARLQTDRERGRAPRALILAPTRELAKQTAAEIETSAPHLATTVIYGGSAYGPQERDLKRGVDILVGTPGRVIDHLDRGNLNLSEVQVAVLDEADEMLSMGFSEAVERILQETPKERQTMLFSATIPHWVKRLADNYQREPVVVDLVGRDSAVQASTTRHIAIRVTPATRTRTLADLLTVLNPERAIVFTRTKADSDELALELVHRGIEADAIHGDLAQTQRERALGSFRAGRTRVLVATDVAARGLDIPEVDLVVQNHFPNDAEAYVHRSGRTGRAGREGTAVVLYTDREHRLIRNLEHETGVFFERRDAPKTSEVRSAAAANAAALVRAVPLDAYEPFMQEAQRLHDEGGVEALAAALAFIGGVHQAPPPASLITGEEGMTTLLLRAPRLSVARAVAVIAGSSGLSSRNIGKVRQFQGGVAADVPTDAVDRILALGPLEGEIEVERAESLPDLIDDAPRKPRYDDRGGYGGNRGGYRGRNDRDGRSSGRRY
ncbi:MAG TPA: DEAD/DEAH box helicase [Deinococcales bacterium]|nr:DEAD/DEAH box helicase [Deinococcales bacterium]